MSLNEGFGLKLQLAKREQLTRVDRVELRTPDGEVLQTWEAVDGKVVVPPFEEFLPPRFEGKLVAIGAAGKHGERPAEQVALEWHG